MKDDKIFVRMDEPDCSKLPKEEYDWAKTVYGDVNEIIPKDAPKPLGEYVTLSHYVDANLYHDMHSLSITGILHFLIQMPVDWYSKKQATN